jgi:DNA-binding MarR family transcriptional regulator
MPSKRIVLLCVAGPGRTGNLAAHDKYLLDQRIYLQTQGDLVNRLSPLELGAWRGLLRVHARLVHDLDVELRQVHGLPLHEYEVLLTLESAPSRRLRMTELASSVLLSQSGLTRLVDRLVRNGFVERERCVDDRRGFFAQLTDAGQARLEEARVTHLQGVRERFLTRFSDAELAELARRWERLLPGASSE